MGAWRGDFYLWVRSRGAWIAVLVPALVAFAQVALRKLIVLRGAVEVVGGQAQVAEQAELTTNAWAPFVEAVSRGVQIGVPIFVALVALCVVREREWGTVRLPLIRGGSSRARWLLRRWLVLHVVILLALVLLIGAAAAGGALWFDFGNIEEEGYVYLSSEEILEEFRTAFGAAYVALHAAVALALVCSVAAPSPAAAVLAALFGTYAADVIQGMVGHARHTLFAEYLPTLRDGAPLDQVRRLAEGYSDVDAFDTGVLWWPFAEGWVLLGLALVIFRRRRV